MPAIITHDFFGRDALDLVPDRVDLSTAELRAAFLLGNQGPDPLFYLVADPRIQASNRVGNLMHHDRPARLLASLRDALSMLRPDERAVGEAYAAGFLCHYLLDRSMHPLVFWTEHALCDAGVPGLDRTDHGEVHAEIERDLDEMVLFTKTRQTVATWQPWRNILHASDQTLATIDRLYFYMNLWTYSRTLELDCYTCAVKAFRKIQWLFFSPSEKKAQTLGAVERAFSKKRHSLLVAMSHRARAEMTSAFDNHDHKPWANPFTDAPSTESFWDLYEEALDNVFDAVNEFFAPNFDEAAARRLTGDLNFSGQEVDPDGLGGEE